MEPSMPAPSSFDFTFGRSATPREPEEPMRLLLLGDFSGKPKGERVPLAARPCLRVDLDNLDATIAKLAPRVVTPEATVAITSLDDLHPDALFEKVELFRHLRDARARPAPQGADSPLSALLGGAPAQASAPRAGANDDDWLNALLRRVVAPHVVPDTAASTTAYLSAVDSAIAEQMRQFLHAPAFQAIERNWRGVQWLIANLELDENLQLHLLDVTADELQADLDASPDGDVLKTGAYAALVDRWRGQPGAQRWSAMIGLFGVAPSLRDLSLLGALGAIASHSACPFVAGADAALWKSGEGGPAWASLRSSQAARWIGLVAPRLLLRRPYGKRQEPVNAFAFEELAATPTHEQYLWAPGALAFALLLGRSYRLSEGWSFSLGDEREIDDLPSCTRLDAHGEPELVPCAEAFLPDQESERLMAAGLMPLLSHRHRNAVLLARFQSIASPSASLMGLPD
jgi:predicted component of type VI protein secretion system